MLHLKTGLVKFNTFHHCQKWYCSTLAPSIAGILNQDSVGQKFRVNGWVKSARVQKINSFFDIDDGLKHGRLQVVIPSEKIPDRVSYHSAVTVVGTLVKSNHPGQEFELHGEQLELVTPVGNTTSCNQGQNEACDYPFGPRKVYDDDFTRMFPMFRAKLGDFAAMLRVRDSLTHAVHQFFRDRQYIQIQTPILTSNDCEGAGEVFTVVPASNDVIKSIKKENVEDDKCAYFDRNVFLTVSGQLHLEAMCNGLARVYTCNQAFRAETGRSRRHLSEFCMVEAELAFVDKIEQITEVIESLVKNSVKSVVDSNQDDIFTYLKTAKMRKKDSSKLQLDLNHISQITNHPYITMSYHEAMDTLEKHSDKFKSKPRRGAAIGKEHELFLVETHCQGIPVFVIDWPRSAKPFYARRLDNDTVSAVDLLLPEIGELCGGTLREHRPEYLEETIKGNFKDLEWYLDLRKCGAAPTGGFGLGFERLLQYILQINNIRESIPFPRSPHSCRL